MKYIICLLLLSSIVKAKNLELFFNKTDVFLRQHVNENGEVNYESINKDKKPLAYLFFLVKDIDIEKKDSNTQKAFWINMYNLIVIRQVIENYGINNVISIPNFFNEKKYSVAKQEQSLDYIEHTILRSREYDPRYHFVLFSASKGGAKLLNNAYMPDKLHDQMEYQTKERINSENFYEIDNVNNIMYLSQIFEWYEKDFKLVFTNIIDFLNIYSKVKIKKGYTIKYYDFNWELM